MYTGCRGGRRLERCLAGMRLLGYEAERLLAWLALCLPQIISIRAIVARDNSPSCRKVGIGLSIADVGAGIISENAVSFLDVGEVEGVSGLLSCM